MADHKRKTIRAAILALLSAAETGAGTRVFKGRTIPLQKKPTTTENPENSHDGLPAILIYTNNDRSTIYNEAPRKYERVVSVSIEAVLYNSENIDDDLDDIAKEIEDVFHDNRYLYVALTEEADPEELASDTILTETATTFGKLGERDVASVRLAYDVYYYQDSPEGISTIGAPSDFEEAVVVYKVENRLPNENPAPDDAEDNIEVPQ